MDVVEEIEKEKRCRKRRIDEQKHEEEGGN